MSLILALGKASGISNDDLDLITSGVEYLKNDEEEKALASFEQLRKNFAFYATEYPLILQYIKMISRNITEIHVNNLKSLLNVQISIISDNIPDNLEFLNTEDGVDNFEEFVQGVRNLLDSEEDVQNAFVVKDLLATVIQTKETIKSFSAKLSV